MRLSQRLSRLSQTPGKSRAADIRDRLSRPYVNRAGKSLSLGWETLPPLKGAGRVEKADNLLPVYRDEAKGRQKDHGGTAPGKSLPVKLPEVKNSDARDAAGKAAGVRVLQATGHTAPITPAEAMAAAPKLATHGRPTKGNENKGDFITLKARGTSKEFLAARLNRDHPEIAECVKAGDPQRRAALLRLAMGKPMSPTSYRASSRDGDGTGVSLVGTETEKSYLAAVLYPCWFLEAASL